MTSLPWCLDLSLTKAYFPFPPRFLPSAFCLKIWVAFPPPISGSGLPQSPCKALQMQQPTGLGATSYPRRAVCSAISGSAADRPTQGTRNQRISCRQERPLLANSLGGTSPCAGIERGGGWSSTNQGHARTVCWHWKDASQGKEAHCRRSLMQASRTYVRTYVPDDALVRPRRCFPLSFIHSICSRQSRPSRPILRLMTASQSGL